MANRDLTQAERDTLEALVDSANLGAVLEALVEICGEKAEHIRANWQDRETARVWDTGAGRVARAAVEIPHALNC
jgi:hypothetical protein